MCSNTVTRNRAAKRNFWVQTRFRNVASLVLSDADACINAGKFVTIILKEWIWDILGRGLDVIVNI